MIPCNVSSISLVFDFCSPVVQILLRFVFLIPLFVGLSIVHCKCIFANRPILSSDVLAVDYIIPHSLSKHFRLNIYT